jgi:PAS domain S-box-containing protein
MSTENYLQRIKELEEQNKKLERELSFLQSEVNDKAKESKYRILIENINDLVCEIDSKGVYTFLSENYKEVLGYKPEELLGKPATALIHPEDLEASLDKYEKLKDQSGKSNDIWRFLHKDGKYRYIQSRGSAYQYSKDEIRTVVVSSDITDRKLAENEIKDSANFTNALLNAIPTAAFYKDKNGKYLGCNNAFTEIMGVTSEEIHGKTVFELWPSDQAKTYHQNDINLMNNPHHQTYEFEITDKDNNIRPVIYAKDVFYDKQGNVAGLIGSFMDITERKKAEDELKKKERDLRSIVENPAGYIIYRTRLNREIGIIEVNQVSPSFTEVLGISEEDKYDFQKWFAYIHPEDLPSLMQANQEGMQPPFRFSMETRYNHPVKGLRWLYIRANGIPYEDDPNMIEYANGIILDITDRKEAEQKLIAAKEKAEESDRLKSAFLSNMSHEIRTPMNGILGFTNLLKKPELSGEKQQKYIDIIEKSGKRMLSTIEDIIDISKIESGQVNITLSKININKQIDELFDFFYPETIQKNIDFSLKKQLPDHKAEIKTDKDKLNSILTNLIKNAIKFTNKGYIEIGYTIKNSEGNTLLNIYVKDSGIGIPEDRTTAVFNRFEQADIEDINVYEGSGLGLAISKAYVEMLNGKIWVESNLDSGSAFYFTIPFTSEDNLNQINENSTNANKKPIKKKLKILIVEDEETSIEYLKTILEDYSDELLVATDGVETVEICKNKSDLDLILMDIKMPGINGHEATRKIRSFNKDILIIAQTAYAQVGDKEKCLASGCNDYLTKPIDEDELLKVISKYINVS